MKGEGVVLNRSRRVGVASGKITDKVGRLLAHGTTTCLIFQSEANNTTKACGDGFVISGRDGFFDSVKPR